MARIKTSSFFIATKVEDILTTGTNQTLDISQFVDAPAGQAILIEQVAFNWYNDSTLLPLVTTGSTDVQWTGQLKDSTSGVLIDPISEDLISQSHYVADGAGGVYSEDDMMPDVMGYAAGEGRLVISSNLQLTCQGSAALANASCSVRIKARVVTLDQKDWIALALQSVAE